MMMLPILLMAHLKLNANAQPGSTSTVPTQGIETQLNEEADGTTNTQIQGSQAALNEMNKQVEDLLNELKQLADEEKKLKQKLKGEQSGALGSDTQQQLQQIQGQIEQKQQERQQLKLKLQQLQQQEQQRQVPPPRLRH